jgi:hypothetical protein
MVQDPQTQPSEDAGCEFVLVPREPTQEMVTAAFEARDHVGSALGRAAEGGFSSGVICMWGAMLDAAPKCEICNQPHSLGTPHIRAKTTSPSPTGDSEAGKLADRIERPLLVERHVYEFGFSRDECLQLVAALRTPATSAPATGHRLSDQAVAAMIEPLVWRQQIGGEGGISDAIADWRGEDNLVESNKIVEELCLKIARKMLAVITPTSAPAGDVGDQLKGEFRMAARGGALNMSVPVMEYLIDKYVGPLVSRIAELREAAKGQLVVVNAANARVEAAEQALRVAMEVLSRAKSYEKSARDGIPLIYDANLKSAQETFADMIGHIVSDLTAALTGAGEK